MIPTEGSVSWENVSSDRSMIRPATLGPRSSTTHVVEAPFSMSTTVTTVPNAMSGLAHVPARAGYHDAFPVSSFAGATGGAAGAAV